MIRDDLFSFEFIKKSAFYGSYRGMQYRIGREAALVSAQGGTEKTQDAPGAGQTGKDAEKPADELEACIYPGPFCFEYTPEEEKTRKRFAFSPEGYEEAKDWLEKMYRENEDKWR